MARNLLTTLKIKNTNPGSNQVKLSDGDRLQLVAYSSGSKVFRVAYRWEGKQQTYTIGNFPAVSLAAARVERDKVNAWLADGKNPRIEKIRQAASQREADGNIFEEVAKSFIKSKAGVRTAKATLDKYYWCLKAIPKDISALPVADVKTRNPVTVCKAIRDQGLIDKAYRTHGFFKQVMEHAVNEGLIETNPIGSSNYLGSRLIHSQKATRMARATADMKFLASLS